MTQLAQPRTDANGAVLKAGDWVAVYGQVDEHQDRTPHEDIVVQFYSHNSQWLGHVHKTRVVTVDPETLPAGLVFQCTHLNKTGLFFVRCYKHENHSGDHQPSPTGMTWTSEQSVGFIEDK